MSPTHKAHSVRGVGCFARGARRNRSENSVSPFLGGGLFAIVTHGVLQRVPQRTTHSNLEPHAPSRYKFYLVFFVLLIFLELTSRTHI